MHENDPAFGQKGLGHANSHTTTRALSFTNDETALVDMTFPTQEIIPTTIKQEKVHEQQLSLWGLVPVTTALCATLFCMSLDATILATAIPKITTEFNSLDDVAWYGSAYLFATCAVQLMFGKLYTFYSSKWIFITALSIFEVGSVVCATAPTSTALIVGRAVAGLGSAGLFTGALIIVNTLVPLRIRPIYIGLVSSMHAIASVAGPIMGGVFTDRLTWRWCFYINLPFGGFAVLMILLCLPSNSLSVTKLSWKEQLKHYDLPGTLVLIPSIICLIIALQWGGSTYPWDNGRIIALFVIAGVLFTVFVGIQIWQKDRATLPMRLLKNRNIWGAVWYGSFVGAAMCIVTYYLPIWFQAVKGESAEQSGIHNLPCMIGLVIFAIIGGVTASVVGYYTPLIFLSSAVTAVGIGLLSTLKPNSGIGYWFGYQVLLSAGMGIGAQNMMLVTSVAVDISDMPMATSILTFTQILATAIILPVGQAVFQNQLITNFQSMLPDINAALIMASGATGFSRIISADQLPLALSAYNKTLCQTFYVAVATSSISIVGPIFMEWLSLKAVVKDQERAEEEERKVRVNG
ncbi:Efflux pump [Penicillium longicatenatum]|uniref:Efflux pump n=1 Tax=Penicillium longicatenatum TaxID=1561947 RepID=UPI00254775C7|nr:Efflux pump [Penicillium longicatenatum]KAJ5658307.1 Efflux pump [Penicillium longicatenatum]